MPDFNNLGVSLLVLVELDLFLHVAVQRDELKFLLKIGNGLNDLFNLHFDVLLSVNKLRTTPDEDELSLSEAYLLLCLRLINNLSIIKSRGAIFVHC